MMLVVDLGRTDLFNCVGNVSAIVLAVTAINPIAHRLDHAEFQLATPRIVSVLFISRRQ